MNFAALISDIETLFGFVQSEPAQVLAEAPAAVTKAETVVNTDLAGAESVANAAVVVRAEQ